MTAVADFLFEARMLKDIPRSGYAFLGGGVESVAEHTFGTALVGLVLGRLEPRADGRRLLTLCLLHDLPEARVGDLHHLQRRYVTADETRAVADTTAGLDIDLPYADALAEFNAGRTLEARLARDADQLALMLELKALVDRGCPRARHWLEGARERLATPAGRRLAAEILTTAWNAWQHRRAE